jgi:hypothetical protein
MVPHSLNGGSLDGGSEVSWQDGERTFQRSLLKSKVTNPSQQQLSRLPFSPLRRTLLHERRVYC